MKKWIKIISAGALASLVFVSCKKDETRAIAVPLSASTFSVNPATVILDSSAANRNNTAVTFSWTASNFNYKAAVIYTIQFAKAGTNFANAFPIELKGVLQKSFSHADFNNIVSQVGLAFGVAGQLDTRLIATLGTSRVDTLFSNKITMTVTPYQVIINYPSLWVPGDYQGWNPASAPKVSSKFGNGNYEGYVNIPSGGTYAFKFTSDPDWNHTNYGRSGTVTISGNTASGSLSTSGSASDLSVAGINGGYYRMKVNINNLTWSGTKTTWGIIGSAPIASNNWSVDVPMTYDGATQTWTVTTNCNAGAFKFRANSDWNDPQNNFGDASPADGVPDYNSNDINIPVAGNYTFTLDLHIPGNYSYKARKN